MGKAERDLTKPVKITVSDPETGAVLDERVIANDYIVVCAGNRYVDYTQVMGSTHMLCIKRERRK